MWRQRSQPWARGLLGATVAGSAVWAYVLLDRTPDWLPVLRVLVLVGGIAAGVAIALMTSVTRRVAAVLLVAALAVGLAAPAAYSLQTAATPHTGAIPSAGPAGASTGGMGGPGGGRGGGGFGGPGGAGAGGQTGAAGRPA